VSFYATLRPCHRKSLWGVYFAKIVRGAAAARFLAADDTEGRTGLVSPSRRVQRRLRADGQNVANAGVRS
jgi:hypothetical protein